jgi:dTDP-4-amino-4,6-dideoxygalactose transaminase
MSFCWDREVSAMIPISRPWLGDEELEALRRPLASGWVAQGPEVDAFEREVAAALGASHACATSSGTTALALALSAVGVAPGDEVVTVSHSFVATANAVRHVGAVPVFVDIEPATFDIDPALAERALTSRTRAILCVHQMGMPCDLARLVDLARRSGVSLVEDAACAIGSEVRIEGEWERIGKPRGAVACFSFHPRKVLTTGEGGMVTTADEGIDARCRSLRQHGRAGAEHRYEELGYNFRMSDLNAAVGRAQLRRLERAVSKRRALAARYDELLRGIAGLVLPREPAWARTNWQSYCVRLPDGVDQRDVLRSLERAGVAALGGVMCAHREPAYEREPWSAGPGGLEQSEIAQDGCLMLPMFHDLTDEDQKHVAAALAAAVAPQRSTKR